MADFPKAPITCHVLDTTTGQPAAGIKVQLTLHGNYNNPDDFSGVTNADGRVTEWENVSSGLHELGDFFKALNKYATEESSGSKDRVTWQLNFETKEYFKDAGWWEDIQIRFVTDLESWKDEGARRHWHVPLLLSPYSYTTYRGS